MGSWYAAWQAGKCNEAQSRYWGPKPSEELYELAADPYELNNLFGDNNQAARLVNMRQTLRAEMIAMRDIGFIPEAMFSRLAADKTIYVYAQSDAYPIERIIDLADKATSRDSKHLPDLVAALDDGHPVIRYWGATGCLILQDKAAPAKSKLLAELNDDWASNRIVAAEALGYLGESDAAVAALEDVLAADDHYASLEALNTLDFMRQAGHVTLARAQSIVKDLKLSEPADRIPTYLLGLEP
jgi:hypothetical protein